MKKLPLSLLFISLSAVRAAEDDITILQRDGTNKNAPVTINGATHAGKTLGFNATTGVLQAMDTGLFSGATVTLGGGASSLELRFLEPSGGGTSYTGFKAPALAGSVMYTLPAAAGTEGQVLAATATPTTLEWATPASGSFDSAAVDATTWSDGANASNVWTFDLSGTDPEITFASGAVQVSAGIFQIGTVTPTVPTENPAMQIARTVTGTGDHAHGFFDGSNFVAAGFGYNSFDAIPHVTGASDHSCGFQARQHHAPGGGNTIAKWYGFFARPYIDSGITTEIQQVRLVNATLSGGGTVPGVQYGLRVDDFTSSSFYNVPLGIDGSSTGSTQAIQASWHQPRISFGTGNVPSNNNQVEITPLASTVSGRTGLAITGGSTTGAGSLPALSIAQTWNTSGSPALIYGRVTNTASGASSMLLDLGTVANGSLFSVSKTGTLAVADNVRQTFNPGADAAGINVGSHAGDPGTPANGDLWYDSTANELTARINGANVALGGGSGSVATDSIWDAAGDLVYGTGANTASRLAVGTANQLLQVNAGATAPEWTSSVNLTTVTATTGNIGSLVFEGATADAFETTLAVTDPTADRTWTFGNVSATITATDGATLTFQGTDTYIGRATTDTLTNKTLTSPTVNDGSHDLDGGTLEIPNGADPDLTVEGQISYETDIDHIRGYDGTQQVSLARKIEDIQVTVIAPNDLADSERDAMWVWENVSGMSFVVTGWSFKSDTDDTTLNIEEIDGDGANNTTVDAVEIATDGTGLFYASDTTITAATIETGHVLVLDFDDTDTPGQVKGVIYGFFTPP